MVQISNKALTYILFLAIIFSVGSTILSLHRVNQLSGSQITGFATSGTGMVNVTIAGVTSIALADSVINFGSCAPNATTGAILSSNDSNAWGAPGVCTGGSTPDNITVQNDGNQHINVTVKSNVIAGASFIGGTNPQFYFSTRNSSSRPGCYNATGYNGYIRPDGFDGGGLQWSWANFTAANTGYLACANLTYTDANDQFELFVRLYLPPDAPVTPLAQNATLTFTAVNW